MNGTGGKVLDILFCTNIKKKLRQILRILSSDLPFPIL